MKQKKVIPPETKNEKRLLKNLRNGERVIPLHALDNPLTETMSNIILRLDEKHLTEEEENFVKDILEYIALTPTYTRNMFKKFRVRNKKFVNFNNLADSIFAKCQNGRVIAEIDGEEVIVDKFEDVEKTC